MLSKSDVTLPGDGPLVLHDPGEYAEPVKPAAGTSTLTGGPAAPPAEPPAPAPAAPPKTPARPPRRFRDDREEVARIARRSHEELEKEIADHQERMFRGERGYTSEGLRDLILRRDHDDNTKLFEIDDAGRVHDANEERPLDVKSSDTWAVSLPDLPEGQAWDRGMLQPIISDLGRQDVDTKEIESFFGLLTSEPTVKSGAEGAAALRAELGDQKARELGVVTEWFLAEATGIVPYRAVRWLEERGFLEDPPVLKAIYAHALPRWKAEQRRLEIMKNPAHPYWHGSREAVQEVAELSAKARGKRPLFSVR